MKINHHVPAEGIYHSCQTREIKDACSYELGKWYSTKNLLYIICNTGMYTSNAPQN